MQTRRTLLVLGICALVALGGSVLWRTPAPGYAQSPKMYWGNSPGGTIQRADLDGTNVETCITGLNAPNAIALDTLNGKIYWADPGSDKIQRANLTCPSTPEDLVTTGLQDAEGIALDTGGGKMYWTDVTADRIERANLDGSGRTVLCTVANVIRGIALDLPAGKMYWTNSTIIQRANLDCSGIETCATGAGDARHVALAAGKVYWGNAAAGKIQRRSSDCTGSVEDCVTGLVEPQGVALDFRGKIYWTDNLDHKVQRSNLACPGGVPELLVTTGTDGPISLALDLGGVGGIVELPEAAGTPQQAGESSSFSVGVLAGIVAAVAVGTVALGGAAWWVRRRGTGGLTSDG